MKRDVKHGCWNVYEMVHDSVHHECLGGYPSVLLRLFADHVAGCAGGLVVPSYKPRRPPLDSFQLLDVKSWCGCPMMRWHTLGYDINEIADRNTWRTREISAASIYAKSSSHPHISSHCGHPQAQAHPQEPTPIRYTQSPSHPQMPTLDRYTQSPSHPLTPTHGAHSQSPPQPQIPTHTDS